MFRVEMVKVFTFLLSLLILGACSRNDQSAHNEESLYYAESDPITVMKALPDEVAQYQVNCPSDSSTNSDEEAKSTNDSDDRSEEVEKDKKCKDKKDQSNKGKSNKNHKYTKMDHHKKNNSKVCIAICHRPPGNPENAKSKVLPLEAIVAHLNHGNSKHHVHRDTLGYCDNTDENSEQNNGDTNDSSSNDDTGSSDDGNSNDDTGGNGEQTPDDSGDSNSNDDTGASDDGISNDDTTGNDEQTPDDSGDSNSNDDTGASDDVMDYDNIPSWCEANYDIDRNCDGIIDETGENLFANY